VAHQIVECLRRPSEAWQGHWHDLIQEEREGLNCLILGLKVCETAEGLCMNGRLEEWTSEGAMQHLVKRDTTETSLR